MNDRCISLLLQLQAVDAENGTGRWVHLCPAGRFVGRDGRGPYVADDLNGIIKASAEFAGNGSLPVDYDHQIDLSAKNGQPAIAAGWITDLQARPNGIWGLVEWTDKAALHIANKEYRHLSPAMIVQNGSGRVVRIERAALTNNPNLRELTALASMETNPMDPELNVFLAALKQTLSLPGDADYQAILDAVGKLTTSKSMHSAEPDPAMYVPIAEFEKVTTELAKLHQGVSLQSAEMHVAAQIAAGNMFPFLKDWGVALCSTNKPAFDAFVSRTRKGVNSLFKPFDFGDRSVSRDTSLSEEERTVCLSMGITAEEYRASQDFTEGHSK